MESCLADGTCGFRWDRGEYDGDVSNGPAGQQMSALAALSTLLLDNSDGPLTNSTGGTSVGDPNAGSSAFELDPMRQITAGDKAGAAIVTIVVAGSFVGSLVWMSGGLFEVS